MKLPAQSPSARTTSSFRQLKTIIKNCSYNCTTSKDNVKVYTQKSVRVSRRGRGISKADSGTPPRQRRAMPARRGRARKGDRRIDAAIDHFTVMGYAARDVRAVVAHLLEVYGGPSAWPLLEDGSYQVVQEKLFEKEDEEKQKQDQPLLLEGQQVEELPPQMVSLLKDPLVVCPTCILKDPSPMDHVPVPPSLVSTVN
ncbi:hypothetical protein PAHAL_2G194400 [Panicum hallii]|uniref:WIYLD domain-containing protein n=1 Tax=Panicum hallii TaxID=206008 RepID=A0A2S3GYD4_9POAL|nr:hypothetical protein PAHAL_2G194400 [Panicum hallii]PVH64125.1 hypothetical protein PAHAL_2G194400 [Panicum hallii]